MQDAVIVGGAMVAAGVFLCLFAWGVLRIGTYETYAYTAWLERRRRFHKIVGVILIAGGVIVFLRESGMLAAWFATPT